MGIVIRNRFIIGFILLTIFGLSLFTIVVYDRSLDFKNNREIQVYRLLSSQFQQHIYDGNNTVKSINDELSEYVNIKKSTDEMFYLIGQQGEIIIGSHKDANRQSLVKNLFANENSNEGTINLGEKSYYWIRYSRLISDEKLNLFLIYPLSISALHEFYQAFGIPLIITSIVILWMVFWVAAFISSMVEKLNQQRQALAEQAEDLANARDQALNASQAKSSFLANMSHEIRTPLTSIIGYAESSLDIEQSMQERSHAINTIIRSGKHLLHIINEILDLSKIEAGKLDVEKMPVELIELIDEISTLIDLQAVEKNITFKVHYKFPIPKIIDTDPLRLKQVLLNLCSNAIKFTKQGHVYLNISYDMQSSKIRFDVVDTGVGMTTEQLESIFKPFQQADLSTTRKYGGTGLGLTLSKQLIEKLDGEIKVKSTLHKGSTFSIYLQNKETSDDNFIYELDDKSELVTKSQLFEKKNQIQLKGKVLLVEDNEDIRNLVGMYLSKTGSDVNYAENGKVAIEKINENTYDIIFMDIQMPVMDGLSAIKILRDDGYKSPVIAMTANAMKSDQETYLAAGYDDFISKPVDRDALISVMRHYLPQSSEKQQAKDIIVSTLIEHEPELIDLVDKFIARIPGILSTILQAHSDQDWEELKRLIHQLKGTGGGYGYTELTKLAEKIEFQVAGKDFAAVTKLIELLQEMVSQIVAGKDKNRQLAEKNKK